MKKLPDTLKINIEGADKGCAFFALYAGLRLYLEYKKESVNDPIPNTLSIAAAEAYCMLEDLNERYPDQYSEAKEEYDNTVMLRNLKKP